MEKHTAVEQQREEQDYAVALEMASIDERPIEWLWPGRIVMENLTLLAGEPLTGKSALAIEQMKDVELLAEVAQGIKRRTLERACKHLSIKHYRTMAGGPVWIRLPSAKKLAEKNRKNGGGVGGQAAKAGNHGTFSHEACPPVGGVGGGVGGVGNQESAFDKLRPGEDGEQRSRSEVRSQRVRQAQASSTGSPPASSGQGKSERFLGKFWAAKTEGSRWSRCGGRIETEALKNAESKWTGNALAANSSESTPG